MDTNNYINNAYKVAHKVQNEITANFYWIKSTIDIFPEINGKINNPLEISVITSLTNRDDRIEFENFLNHQIEKIAMQEGIHTNITQYSPQQKYGFAKSVQKNPTPKSNIRKLEPRYRHDKAI